MATLNHAQISHLAVVLEALTDASRYHKIQLEPVKILVDGEPIGLITYSDSSMHSSYQRAVLEQ